MNKFVWTETAIENFIEEHYNELLEEYIKDRPEAWEAFQITIVKPSGRDYCLSEDAPLDIWRSFCRWHQSQTRFDKPYIDWIVDNLPDNEEEYEHE